MKKVLLLVFLVISIEIFAEPQEVNSDLNYAQVVSVEISYVENNVYAFNVGVLHNDEGWNHYAQLWEILDAQTYTVLATRVLLHPHDNEQPFVRSLSRVFIPEETENILIRAKCETHGFGGQTMTLAVSDFPERGETLVVE